MTASAKPPCEMRCSADCTSGSARNSVSVLSVRRCWWVWPNQCAQGAPQNERNAASYQAWDAFNGYHMGNAAENVARKYQITLTCPRNRGRPRHSSPRPTVRPLQDARYP